MIKKTLLFFWILIATLWSTPTYFDLLMVERGASDWISTGGFLMALGLPLGLLYQRKLRIFICVLMTLCGPGFIVMMNPISFHEHSADFIASLIYFAVVFWMGSEFMYLAKFQTLKFRQRQK